VPRAKRNGAFAFSIPRGMARGGSRTNPALPCLPFGIPATVGPNSSNLQDAQRYQEALSAFEQAQAIEPNFPSLRHRIAGAHFLLENCTKALDLYESLVRESPRDVNAWTWLSATLYKCRQWTRSLEAAERAFGINPNDPAQLYHYSLILGEFRRLKRARHLLNRAAVLAPENAKIRYELALEQLADGDYKNGWETFESRFGILKQFLPMVNGPIPRWHGESLAQKILTIWPEQGLGDSILFLRYAFALAERAQREGGLIMFCCYGLLETLFARSLAEYCNEVFVSTLSKGVALHRSIFWGEKTCDAQ
jgi:tetratricopeptide (TPR) repeat protein